MRRAGIPEMFRQVRHHSFQDGRVDWSGPIVIHINEPILLCPLLLLRPLVNRGTKHHQTTTDDQRSLTRHGFFASQRDRFQNIWDVIIMHRFTFSTSCLSSTGSSDEPNPSTKEMNGIDRINASQAFNFRLHFWLLGTLASVLE